MNDDCSYLGTYTDQTENFRQQLIAIGTILVVLCLPTIALNFAIWITVIATRHLHHPPYMIIANLALSDWLAGCISFPTYATICFMQSAGKDPCSISSVTTPIGYVLGIAAFLIVSFQAVERFIGVVYPFQYKVWVTSSMLIITSLVIWLILCSGVIFWVSSRNTQVFNIFIGAIIFIFSSVDIFCHYKIYLKTKKIEKKITNQAKSSSRVRVNRPKSESKVARVTAALMMSVFVCYGPLLGSSLYGSLPGEKAPESYYFLYWSWLFSLVNSIINPLIACTQLSVIRRTVFNSIINPLIACTQLSVIRRTVFSRLKLFAIGNNR